MKYNSKIRVKKQSGGTVDEKINPDIYSAIGSVGGDFGDFLINNAGKSIDFSKNPALNLRQEDTKAVAGDIFKTTAKFAGIGATIGGPWGALAGAAVGATISGAKAITGKDEREEKREKIVDEYKSQRLSQYMAGKSRSSYQHGGDVTKKKRLMLNAESSSKGIKKNEYSLTDDEIKNLPGVLSRMNKHMSLLNEGMVEKDPEWQKHNEFINKTPSFRERNAYIDSVKYEGYLTPEEQQLILGDKYDQYLSDLKYEADFMNKAVPGARKLFGEKETGDYNQLNAGKRVLSRYPYKETVTTVKNIDELNQGIDATKKAFDNMKKQEKAHGGEIEGKGGPKEDAIDRNLPEGSFVVPAENSEKAMEAGIELLGWKKDEKITKRGGGEPVSISNGEVVFMPDEVSLLKYYGYNVDELAPNAQKSNKMATGGLKAAKAAEMLRHGTVHGEPLTGKQKKLFRAVSHGWKPSRIRLSNGGGVWKDRYETFKGEHLKNNPKANEAEVRFVFASELPNDDERKSFMKEYPASKRLYPVMDNQEQPENNSKSFSPAGRNFRPSLNLKERMKESGLGLAELAGASQIALGASKLSTRKPSLTIANELAQVSRDTQAEAAYGLEPGVKSMHMRNIAAARRELANKIVMSGGGDANVSSRLRQVMSEAVRGEQELIGADVSEMARKKGIARDVKFKIADRKHGIEDKKLQDWYAEQEVFADLLNAGISNIVGARKYKKELDYLKGLKTSPTINFNKTD